MNREFIENQSDMKKRPWLICAVIIMSMVEVLLVMISIAATIGAPPLGILMLVGCFFFLKFIIKTAKKSTAAKNRMRVYEGLNHKPSPDLRGDTTYCFVSPFSTPVTLDKIVGALRDIGEVKNVDLSHGVLRGNIQVTSRKKRSVTFYVERNDQQCKVRACFYRLANDDWWDVFLTSLFEKNPGVDFGVTLANGDPLVAGVLNLRGDTKQVSFSQTSGGTSLGGFLVGGALFGDAGAIVGGLSGKQRTVTNSKTVFSNELLVRVIYTNGRLWEGTVIKGSQLYHEIMVNMK